MVRRRLWRHENKAEMECEECVDCRMRDVTSYDVVHSSLGFVGCRVYFFSNISTRRLNHYALVTEITNHGYTYKSYKLIRINLKIAYTYLIVCFYKENDNLEVKCKRGRTNLNVALLKTFFILFHNKRFENNVINFRTLFLGPKGT